MLFKNIEITGNEKIDLAILYFFWVLAEEGLFRSIPLGLIQGWIGIFATALIYGFAHRIFFKWQMVIVAIPFGVLLAKIYLWSPMIWGYPCCVGLHWTVGCGMVAIGLTDKWMKE